VSFCGLVRVVTLCLLGDHIHVCFAGCVVHKQTGDHYFLCNGCVRST